MYCLMVPAYQNNKVLIRRSLVSYLIPDGEMNSPRSQHETDAILTVMRSIFLREINQDLLLRTDNPSLRQIAMENLGFTRQVILSGFKEYF